MATHAYGETFINAQNTRQSSNVTSTGWAKK